MLTKLLGEIDPDALICTACFSGSIAPETYEVSAEADLIARPDCIRRPMVESVRVSVACGRVAARPSSQQ